MSCPPKLNAQIINLAGKEPTEIPRGTRYRKYERIKNKWYFSYWNWESQRFEGKQLCDPQPFSRFADQTKNKF